MTEISQAALDQSHPAVVASWAEMRSENERLRARNVQCERDWNRAWDLQQQASADRSRMEKALHGLCDAIHPNFAAIVHAPLDRVPDPWRSAVAALRPAPVEGDAEEGQQL